jgi:AraC-like DNA-binding protein
MGLTEAAEEFVSDDVFRRRRGLGREMAPSPTATAFARDRFGHAYVGSRFVIWCPDPTIGGAVAWGRLGDADAFEITQATAFDVDPTRDPPYDMVIDASRVEHVSTGFFARYVRETFPRFFKPERYVRRLAIVVPEGILRALTVGALHVSPSRGEWRTFLDAREAFAWVERSDLCDVIDDLTTRARSNGTLVPTLRDWLFAHLRQPEMSHAARDLGRSTRSLQRALAAEGTTFRQELDAVRMEAARAMLADPGTKIGAIARRLGYASASAFTATFLRRIGELPRAYRARRARRTDGDFDPPDVSTGEPA